MITWWWFLQVFYWRSIGYFWLVQWVFLLKYWKYLRSYGMQFSNKTKINVFKSYLFKLLFILMILSISLLLEEKIISYISQSLPKGQNHLRTTICEFSEIQHTPCPYHLWKSCLSFKLSSNAFLQEIFPSSPTEESPLHFGDPCSILFLRIFLWHLHDYTLI